MNFEKRAVLLAMVFLQVGLGAQPARSQVPDEPITLRSGCYELHWGSGVLPQELQQLEDAVWLTPAPFASPEVLNVDSWQLYVVRPAPGRAASPYAIVGWRVFEETIIVRWHGGPGIGISVEAAEESEGSYAGVARIFGDQLGVEHTPIPVSLRSVSC